MRFNPDGTASFDTYGDLYFHLFIEMGLSINKDSYLFDQDSGSNMPLLFDGKSIKANTKDQPIYVGENEIAFDPTTNYSVMSKLFYFYLDKYNNSDEVLYRYLAHSIEDDPNKEKQCVCIKHQGGKIYTHYYYNLYLAFIEMVFILNDSYSVNLSNFDIKKFDKK